MDLKQLRHHFFNELNTVYPKTETESFFYILTEHFLGLKRIDIALQKEPEIKPELLKEFSLAIEDLKKEKPVQYITGETEFYGFPFKVSENVLIPRPETEELVDWIVKETKSKVRKGEKKKLRILDIGTGSGCIAVTLSKLLPGTEVSAIDISDKALKIAKENALLNHTPVYFIKKDILHTRHLEQKYDIIVSNPPYVKYDEKAQMKKNVLDHEPHIALFVDNNDPLLFYRHIADLAKTGLLKNGTLYFEINQAFGKEIKKMLKNKGFINTVVKKDIFGADRMIRCIKK